MENRSIAPLIHKLHRHNVHYITDITYKTSALSLYSFKLLHHLLYLVRKYIYIYIFIVCHKGLPLWSDSIKPGDSYVLR